MHFSYALCLRLDTSNFSKPCDITSSTRDGELILGTGFIPGVRITLLSSVSFSFLVTLAVL